MQEHNEEEILEREEENVEDMPECLFHSRPCCPFAGLTLFWKVAIVATAVLMLILVFTMYSLTREFSRYTTSIVDAKLEILATINKVEEKVVHVEDTVNQHKQLTMENRVVQSESRGILVGWIEERRRMDNQIQQLLDRVRK